MSSEYLWILSYFFVLEQSGRRLRFSATWEDGVLMQRVRRDATKIIYEILSLGIDGASKTHIIYRANLSYQLAERYIFFLVKKGLLREGTDSDGFTKYWITERGVRLLRLLRDVERELGDFFSQASFLRDRSSGSSLTVPSDPRY
jgi:predicted transcriptional regulator